MTFNELIHHPPFQIALFGSLLAVALLAGTLIWYFKVGKKREAQFNEKQRKHAAFRRVFSLFMMLGIYVWIPLTRDLPVIPLRNGDYLPIQLLICIAYPALMVAIMTILGRLIFGEEGRLKPKKNITQQEDNHDTHPQA